MRNVIYLRAMLVAFVLAGSLAWTPVLNEVLAKEGSAAHEVHEGHGEEGEGELSLEEITKARCEHDMSTYQCNECRYEVGVVKVPESLLKSSVKAPGGLVAIELAAKCTFAPGLNVTGEVRLNENAAVHVGPRIPGIIESVAVDIGARVKKGDVLFKMNSVEFGKALADYERGRSLTALSLKNFEREKALLQRKIASERDVIGAQMAYEQHRTELKSAEQVLQAIGLTDEDLKALQKEAHDATFGSLSVRASIAGVIIEKHAVVGELVEPGKDVMLLADLGSVWVWADIYEQDFPRLLTAEKKGPIPVQVFVRSFPDRPFRGTIDYVGATMQEHTRTIKVRATVQNAAGLLRPGMFCEIRIALGEREEVLAVPKAALLSDEGKDFLFEHWKEDFYVRRGVRKGRDFVDAVEVLDGVKAGARVVTVGSFLLKSDVLREKMGAGCAD